MTLQLRVSGAFLIAGVSPPAAPVLTLGSPTTTTQALSWPAVSGAGNYNVYRAVHGGSYTRFENTIGTSSTVTGLSTGTSYDYKVAAVNAGGEGVASNVVTGSTL